MEKFFIIAITIIFIAGVISGKGQYADNSISYKQSVSTRQGQLASEVYTYYDSTTGSQYYDYNGTHDTKYVEPLVGYQFYLEDLHKNGPRYIR